MQQLALATVSETQGEGLLRSDNEARAKIRQTFEDEYRKRTDRSQMTAQQLDEEALQVYRSLAAHIPTGTALQRKADLLRLMSALEGEHDELHWSTMEHELRATLQLLIFEDPANLPNADFSQLTRQIQLGFKHQLDRRAGRDRLAAAVEHRDITQDVHVLGDDLTGYKFLPRYIYIGSDTFRLHASLAAQEHVPFQGVAESLNILRHRIKIGSTSNWQSRERVYKSHNPDFRMWLVYTIQLQDLSAPLQVLTCSQVTWVERQVQAAVVTRFGAALENVDENGSRRSRCLLLLSRDRHPIRGCNCPRTPAWNS